MLGTLDIEFDHADFLRKLRHYFMDSAPVDVDLVIKANSVLIKGLRSDKEVEYYLNSERSVKDNIHDLAVLCEKSIYPVLEKEIIIKKNLSLEERKQYLIQGLTLEDIEQKSYVKDFKTYYLARVSMPSMTMIIKSSEGEVYLARFRQPLVRLLKDLEKLSPVERFAYIQSHSDIKDITNEVR